MSNGQYNDFPRVYQEQGVVKSFYLETFGCQMNVHDSERIGWLLSSEGYIHTDNPEEADLIIINSCSIREKAEDKVYSRLGRLFVLRREKPSLKIGLAGCMAQRLGKKIFKQFPGINLVVGSDSIHLIPRLVKLELETGEPQVGLDVQESYNVDIGGFTPGHPIKAYISIMRGCNNYCSYCIVPYVRGREVSRPMGKILDEVKSLVDRGYKEVTLLGQNVNSYRDENGVGARFSDLLISLDSIGGLERIRFTTSHPKDFTEDIIDCISSLKTICEHVHLPIQSGSNKIIAFMNRGYNREDYLSKIELLRKKVKGVAITTDIIVGFPNEDERDFRETVDILESVRFDSIFAFHFSKRKGTKAYLLEDTVPDKEKQARLNYVNRLQREISESINAALLGSIQEVLVDGHSPKNEEYLSGRTRTNKIVNFPFYPGVMYTLQNVRIESSSPYALKGVISRNS